MMDLHILLDPVTDHGFCTDNVLLRRPGKFNKDSDAVAAPILWFSSLDGSHNMIRGCSFIS